MCCRYSCFGGGAFGAALAPLMRSLTDGWYRYTGPRPSQPWCVALPACTVACLPSQSLSFPLQICNLFRINSSFVLSMSIRSPVSPISIYFTRPLAVQSCMCSFGVFHSLAVHRTEAVAAVVCCIACKHPPMPPISISFIPSPDM